MSEFWLAYGLFAAKAVTIVVAILVVVFGIASVISRGRGRVHDHITIKHLNRHFENLRRTLYTAMLSKQELKQALKTQARGQNRRKRVFVLNFEGDLRASGVTTLREEITAVLMAATRDDEVLLKLESPGGVVHGYGLAASQLQRVKDRNIPLIIAVDKVAASGGYLMACVADRILAAPFAVVGSIGVVAQLPNFNRLLKKNHIDYELLTAGEYKRTLTMFGENTEQDRAKFREELEDTHRLFKQFVKDNRTALDIEQVATGEHWYGARALEHRLVDEIRTSDDYLLAAAEHADLYEVKYKGKTALMQRFLKPITALWPQGLA